MCGILGYSHIAKGLPSSVLDSALDALSHRGPDWKGRFVSGDISLGAARLRILDMDHGDQPLFSPDRDVVVIFNGEIFNQHEIRSELQREGVQFETNCDTERSEERRVGKECRSRGVACREKKRERHK